MCLRRRPMRRAGGSGPTAGRFAGSNPRDLAVRGRLRDLRPARRTGPGPELEDRHAALGQAPLWVVLDGEWMGRVGFGG